jgi:enoyl-CoA hydratase/carnithine racemase
MPPYLYPYLFTENPNEQDPVEYLLRWSQYLPYHIIVKTIQTIMDSGKVYIAAVNGVCYQTELLYPLDFVIAADVATFAQGDVSRMGIVPAAGSTQTLPRVLGRRRAIEIMLTGDTLSAEDAYRIGLVNKVVPLSQLMEEAEALARKVARYPQHAIKLTKMAITKAQDLPLKQGLEIEGYYSRISHTRADYGKFAKTFLAERKAAREKKGKS